MSTPGKSNNPKGRTPVALGGKPNKRSVARYAIKVAALRENLSPVDVMLRVMYEFHDEAAKIKVTEEEKALAEKVLHEDDFATKLEYKRESRKVRAAQSKVGRRNKLLMNAKDTAVDVAPYLHPKLSSIQHTDDPDNPIGGDGFQEFADALNKLAAAKAGPNKFTETKGLK